MENKQGKTSEFSPLVSKHIPTSEKEKEEMKKAPYA